MVLKDYVKKRIIKKIMHKCVSNNIHDAFLEWRVTEYDTYDPTIGKELKGGFYSSRWGHCKCGVKIKYCYEINNKFNNKIVRPIGSCCIKRFMPIAYEELQMNVINLGLERLGVHYKCIRCGHKHKKRKNIINRTCIKCEKQETQEEYLKKQVDHLCKRGKYYNRTYEWIYKVDKPYFKWLMNIDNKAKDYYVGLTPPST